MKKILSTILVTIICIFGLTIFSCAKKTDQVEKIVIYTVNDFHGSIEETDGAKGIARIAGFINQTSEDDKTIKLVLSAGDMYQGSALSNAYYGKPVMEIMNMIGFDAMAVGNHEFDWGLEEITKYHDGDADNGEANFPLLAANIIDKRTNEIPTNIKEYTIIEKKGVKIGIIGYIGYGLEDDIATANVENYEFLSPVPIIKTLARKLRTELECDVVITIGHDGSSTTDNQIAKLTDDERIDAIINGHTHTTYVDEYRRSDGYKIQCTQSGSAGSNVGVITISLNKETKQPTSSSAYNKAMNSSVKEDAAVKEYVEQLVADNADIFKRVLCYANENVTRITCSYWAVDALKERFNVDCAFINGGGIRSNAFPIAAGSAVTISKVYEIMPFDNTIKLTSLQGKYIISLINTSDIYYSSSITGNAAMGYYINGVLIDNDAYYTVAAVDYIFDKTSMPFQYGIDSRATGILFRDVLEETLESYQDTGWTINPR